MSLGRTGILARKYGFSGAESGLTREHVLPDWLRETGLDDKPFVHHAWPVPCEWKAVPFRTQISYEAALSSLCTP
jgi:hypothetical protein